MAKAAAGEATLEVGGERYRLRLEIEDMMELEDRLDMSIIDLANELGSGKTPRLTHLVRILQAMVQDVELSAEDAFELFRQEGEKVANAIGLCFQRSFALEDKKPGKPKPAARKKTAK